MSAVTNALSVGYTAKQILDYLLKADKANGPKIKKALEAGHSPEEIIQYLQANYSKSSLAKREGYKPASQRFALPAGMTESERGTLARQQMSGLGPNMPGVVGTFVQNALPLAALGAAGLGAARGAGIVNNILGASAANTAAGTAATASEGGGLVSGIASAIMRKFGFRDKKLVQAVSDLATKTGKEVKDVYDELSKNHDLSTPEKATEAALNRLREIQETRTAPTTLREISERTKSRKEKMGTIKTLDEIRKSFAKDLRSSVIRKTLYNADKNQLKVIFNNNHTYSYDDVPKEVFEELTQGGIPAKTNGKNEFGVWWTGKSPSLGASFNKLIKQGGYTYEKVGNTQMSQEEEEEYSAIRPKNERTSKFLERTEKTRRASGEDKFVGEVRKVLTSDQRRFRIAAMTKQIEQLRKQEPNERREETIKLIEERLKTLKETDTLLRRSKSKVLTEEIMRMEKADGSRMIKRLLLLLPKSVAQVVKNKIETTTEKDALNFIRDYLLTRK